MYSAVVLLQGIYLKKHGILTHQFYIEDLYVEVLCCNVTFRAIDCWLIGVVNSHCNSCNRKVINTVYGNDSDEQN